MSQETLDWLNANVLIGHTSKRGRAWHYLASEQGAEPNHYPDAIPVADVQRRLFDWRVASGPVLVQASELGLVRAQDRQAIYAEDTGDVLGIFAEGYAIHQYPDWLLDKVASILDDGLSIGSAGLLRNRAQAWVSVEIPDNIHTPEGVEFRPNLLACTSHDGSLATTYKRVVTNVVCDNTMSAGLSEAGQVIKVKHSRLSTFRVLDARKALEMVMAVAEDFSAEVRELCRIQVTDQVWREFLKAHAPMGDTPRARNRAGTERAELRRLWDYDERVSPWRGTAWGVVQAVNTYTHHYGAVRGASRAERNLGRAVTSKNEALDRATITTLDKVLADHTGSRSLSIRWIRCEPIRTRSGTRR
jgi:phage/plasmid-like protein (TIGR03299 family)